MKQKFTMNINSQLLKKLKHIAIDEDLTVTEIITKLIKEYVEEYEKNMEWIVMDIIIEEKIMNRFEEIAKENNKNS